MLPSFHFSPRKLPYLPQEIHGESDKLSACRAPGLETWASPPEVTRWWHQVDPYPVDSRALAHLRATFQGLSSFCWGLSPWRIALSHAAGSHAPALLPSDSSSGHGTEAEVKGRSPEPRRPIDYISRCKQAGRGSARVPGGLGVELQLHRLSLFHSLFPACISLLQLRLTVEWAE